MNENVDSELLSNEKEISTSKEPKPVLNGKFTSYLLICLAVVCFGTGFEFGWTFGLFNSPSLVIKQFYLDVYFERCNQTMSESQLNSLWSLSNGGILLGGILGGLTSGILADFFGRKKSLLLVNLFVIISSILSTISKYIKSYEVLITARFISGLVCGLFTGILPIYVNEISPKNLRGLVGTINQVLSVFGKLTTNVFGLSSFLGTPDLWPILVGILLFPSLVHFFLVFLVESPKYLFIHRSDEHAAELALKKLRDNDMLLVENEMKQLMIEKKQSRDKNEVAWKDFITKKQLRRPLVITIVIQFGQNLTGIDAFVFYSTDIFENVGLKDNWPNYATILLSVVQLLMTIVSMLIIDKTGRKPLMIFGMAGISVFSFALAFFRILGEKYSENQWFNYMTVVCAVLYMVSWSIGPSSIPWLITSELFASDSRGKATSIAVFLNWFSAFVVAASFPFIEVAIKSYSFIIFGVFSMLTAIYIVVYVPETKNKSIDEITNKFNY